jgi:hypothetical protein
VKNPGIGFIVKILKNLRIKVWKDKTSRPDIYMMRNFHKKVIPANTLSFSYPCLLRMFEKREILQSLYP